MSNNDQKKLVPDSTAVRVALWRAMHVQIDSPPHVFTDEVGFKLVAPDESWRSRGDMHPLGTKTFRASIVARARFIEDYLKEKISQGVKQYVLLGAGLDSFVQRNPDLASQLQVYEIDKATTQEWKRKRLCEIGYQIPNYLHFVPVDFESGESWWKNLQQNGFSTNKPALVCSIGVSMYLTLDAIKDTLRQMAQLAPGSTFIMTFMLPLQLVDPVDQAGYQMALTGTQKSGTPFISFFSPQEMLNLASDMGFKKVEHLSTASLRSKYFAGRNDGLRPSTGEELLIATTV